MAEPIVNSGVAQVAVEARAMIQEVYNGENMKALALKRRSALESLEATGQIKPCTVINFNPIALKLHDSYAAWTIPACTDKSAKRIKVEHEGKTYVGSYFTVREAQFVAWIRDVKKPADEGGNPTAEYDPKFVLPLEAANQYHIEYNTPEKQNMTGGVLVFEGDVHAFSKAKGNTLRVPKYKTLSDRTRSYFSEETELQLALKTTLDLQKASCQGVIQKGDEYNQDEKERKNITPPMRAWAQFSLEMGWKQQAPSWMNATLDSDESCKGCGAGKKKTGAVFCQCGRPYNALQAFLDGENVPEAYLYALKGKDLELAMAEMHRRDEIKAKFKPKG